MAKTGVRFPRAEAMQVALHLLTVLNPFCERAAISGSLRRGLPDCGDVDVLVVPSVPIKRLHALIRTELCDEPDVEGVNLVVGSVLSIPGGHRVPINVFICAADEWGSSLHYTTGSRDYNVSVRSIAMLKGLYADQHGVFRRVGNRKGEKIEGSSETEADYCRAIGIPWFPPKDRVHDARTPGPYRPKPSWCVDHVTYDFCRRDRRAARQA